MPTLLDVDSSFMNANAQVQEWRAKFLQQWLAPLREAQLMLWWRRQTPEMHAAMRSISPEAYAQVEKKVQELEERRVRNG